MRADKGMEGSGVEGTRLFESEWMDGWMVLMLMMSKEFAFFAAVVVVENFMADQQHSSRSASSSPLHDLKRKLAGWLANKAAFFPNFQKTAKNST